MAGPSPATRVTRNASSAKLSHRRLHIALLPHEAALRGCVPLRRSLRPRTHSLHKQQRFFVLSWSPSLAYVDTPASAQLKGLLSCTLSQETLAAIGTGESNMKSSSFDDVVDALQMGIPIFLRICKLAAESPPGAFGFRPMAPKAARSLPPMESRSKVRASGPEGVGRSLFCHHTKRGALGSPNTSSLSTPASTCSSTLWDDKEMLQY